MAAELANGVIYITPLRNFVIKALFGIGAQDFFSPVSGALMYLGTASAGGRRPVPPLRLSSGCVRQRETLAFMCVLHAFQAAVGLFRAVKTRNAGKLSDDIENELDAFMGAEEGRPPGRSCWGSCRRAGSGRRCGFDFVASRTIGIEFDLSRTIAIGGCYRETASSWIDLRTMRRLIFFSQNGSSLDRDQLSRGLCSRSFGASFLDRCSATLILDVVLGSDRKGHGRRAGRL